LENPEELAAREAGNLRSYRMVSLKYILKTIFFSLCLIPLNISAQTGNKPLPVPDTSKPELKGSSHALYAGGGYGSNMIYLGSTISRNQPYGYGSISYGYRNEFYATLSAVHLSGYSPFMAFYIGSLNYTRTFNNWFDISTGVYRYQVAPSLTDTLFSSFIYCDATFGFDWKILYTKISAGGLFSEGSQAYFQLRNSRYFQTNEFFRKKANLSFDPYVNLLSGTITRVKTTSKTSVMITHPYGQWKKNNPDGLTTTYSNKFGIIELDIGLPVALNTDFMTIEAEPSYVLPLYDDSDYPGAKGFIFLLSVYFRIL
jgi:hypothetical protein